MDTTKVKKILSIVIISLILAVTILTIVLALVPKKLYNPISEGYSAVTVYKDKNSNTYTFTGEISEEQRSFRDNLDITNRHTDFRSIRLFLKRQIRRYCILLSLRLKIALIQGERQPISQ